MTNGRTLLAFVDPKDPFMPGEVAGEDQPGAILSLMEAKSFGRVFLFFTPQMRGNAEATTAEVEDRYPQCWVTLRELPVSDPKDYSSLMGSLAHEVRRLNRETGGDKVFVCVSSGTAEMRAAWFLLTAAGILPATLLQVGSPAEPLYGAANVKEVHLDSADWDGLRDLLMPQAYFSRQSRPVPRASVWLQSEVSCAPEAELGPPPVDAYGELEDALKELRIFVGSAVLRDAAERAAIAAECDLPVLLLGETGSGKEMFAKLIHRLSPRCGREMVAVNCAAIPKELVESHLFGHAKGSFTGAGADSIGKFKKADGGTLFLDEIGELSLDAQAKLLRIVQDGRLEPAGSNHPSTVDVRMIAATNRDLAAEVAAGRFRQDLYYRLEVVQVRLPPLRNRRAEIPRLALTLLQQINQRRRRPRQLSKSALERLERHDWPGNVRELSNVLERSVLYARTDVVEADDLLIVERAGGSDLLAALPEPGEGFSLEEFLAQARKQLILRAVSKANGNQSMAAGMLGISKQAVNKFLKGEDGNGS